LQDAGSRTRLTRAGTLDGPVRGGLALLANVPTVLKVGWHEPLLDARVLHVSQVLLLLGYLAALLLTAFAVIRSPERRRDFLSVTRPEQIIVLFGVLSFAWSPGPKIAAALLIMFHLTRGYLSLVRTAIPAGLVFIGSFVVLIAVGTLALLLPSATPPDRPISFVDSLFTISSAISQTGLVVRPTDSGFTRLGQVIILVWIQVGALGVIVFGALIVNVLGSSMSLRATQTLAEGTEQGWSGQLSLQKLVTFIIIFTHLVELIGALVLYFGWPSSWEGMPADFDSPGDRFYHAVYFSVSSFCNAGFATTPNGLIGLRIHWTTQVIIAGLIMLGSIGFPVLDNMRRVAWDRFRGRRMRDGALVRLTLNSKIILAATASTYVIGVTLMFISEVFGDGAVWQPSDGYGTAVLDASFMSINRTAGFNSVDTSQMGLLSHLGLIFLMFVGGSPGSVAGGIKLMVFSVLAMTVYATLRGRSQTTIFGRTIPEAIVRKSAALVVLALLFLLGATGLLAFTDGPNHTLRELLFETTSALGTCGLSLGITPELTDPGKIIISITMFLGRVGPFAVVAALLNAARSSRARVEYPTEEVVIY
jgi:trk system potassium uptake protein TrkH